mgnify:CR=1 FL=1
MLKNQYKISKYLRQINDEVGLIHLEESNLNNSIKELIQYLSNDKVDSNLWKSEEFPKYIFINQFSSPLLILVTRDDQEIDDFSKTFLGDKHLLSFNDLIS